jgi:MFS family permease
MAQVEPPRLPNIPPEIMPLRARQFRVPKTLVALRHRNYRLFVAGQLVAGIGMWMQIIAQGWLVYQISGSELALGIVGFASAIPALLITLWGGVVVDTLPKRRILLVTQSSSMTLAFILSALTFSGVVQVWHVVVLAACSGAISAFDGPARQAFVVEMVGRDDLPNAIALNSMTFNSARIIGPAIGGVLLVAVGAGWCFFLNGLAFLAVITALLAMRLPPHQARPGSLSAWQRLTSGLDYAWRSAELRGLLLMSFIFSLFGITYSTVLPAFVDRWLGQGPRAFGALNTAAGVGAVTGAFIVAKWGDTGHRGRWLTTAALIYPFVLALFAVNRSYPAALALAVCLGVGFMLIFTLLNTLLQTRISDDMRGRVLSIYTLTFFGFTPFGNLAMGTVAELWGLSQAIILSAVCALVLMVWVILRTPQLRRLP